MIVFVSPGHGHSVKALPHSSRTARRIQVSLQTYIHTVYFLYTFKIVSACTSVSLPSSTSASTFPLYRHCSTLQSQVTHQFPVNFIARNIEKTNFLINNLIIQQQKTPKQPPPARTTRENQMLKKPKFHLGFRI